LPYFWSILFYFNQTNYWIASTQYLLYFASQYLTEMFNFFHIPVKLILRQVHSHTFWYQYSTLTQDVPDPQSTRINNQSLWLVSSLIWMFAMGLSYLIKTSSSFSPAYGTVLAAMSVTIWDDMMSFCHFRVCHMRVCHMS